MSLKKNRLTKDGFDLDMTYITPQLIAMGFPSVTLTSTLSLEDVSEFDDLTYRKGQRASIEIT